MATRRADPNKSVASSRRRATTPEGRENQLIALAVDVAEQQMREGTASAQVITHFLRLGSSTEKLEQKKREMEMELMAARKTQLESQQRAEALLEDALRAFRTYTPEGGFDQIGERGDDHDDDYYDD